MFKNYDQWKLQEQPEGRTIAKDWRENPIQSGYDEDYYYINDEWVIKEEVIDYLDANYGRYTTEEIEDNLRRGA